MYWVPGIASGESSGEAAGRWCKDNLKNRHNKVARGFAGVPPTRIYYVRVDTDWCYSGRPNNQVLTRHSTPDAGVDNYGILNGYYLDKDFWWAKEAGFNPPPPHGSDPHQPDTVGLDRPGPKAA